MTTQTTRERERERESEREAHTHTHTHTQKAPTHRKALDERSSQSCSDGQTQHKHIHNAHTYIHAKHTKNTKHTHKAHTKAPTERRTPGHDVSI